MDAPIVVLDTNILVAGLRSRRGSAFQVLFTMRVGERVAAEGYGWLVGFDYSAETAVPLPERFASVLSDAAQSTPQARPAK